MTALDELRAALHQERWLIASYTDELQANTDAALARVEAELAEAQKRPTLEQVLHDVAWASYRGIGCQPDYRDRMVADAIRALYGEQEDGR